MKESLKICITVIFAAFSFSAISQNWAPYSGDTLHYSSEGKYYPDLSVYQDSVNGDTTFFNTVIDSCYNCPLQGLFLMNQPVFLGYKMVNNYDTTYSFYGIQIFNIKPHNSIGVNWDYGGGNMAEFIEIRFDSLLGLEDSLKIGVINDTDTFILSQNYGLIKLPDLVRNKEYDLVGVESDIGFQDMTFRDAWNFEVGDIIQYKDSNLHLEDTGLDTWVDYYQETILEILPSNNNLFKYRVLRQRWSDSQLVTNEEIVKTINDTTYLTSLAGGYNMLHSSYLVPLFCQSRYEESEIWGITKVSGSDRRNLWPNFENIPNLEIYNGDTLSGRDFIGDFFLEFTHGLGQSYWSFNGFESFHTDEIICVISAPDTFGSYRDLLLFSSINYIGIQQISVYPNPTQNIIHISNLSDFVKNDTYLIEIYNTLGERIINKEIQDVASFEGIDVSELASGIYFLALKVEGVAMGKSKLMIK